MNSASVQRESLGYEIARLKKNVWGKGWSEVYMPWGLLALWIRGKLILWCSLSSCHLNKLMQKKDDYPYSVAIFLSHMNHLTGNLLLDYSQSPNWLKSNRNPSSWPAPRPIRPLDLPLTPQKKHLLSIAYFIAPPCKFFAHRPPFKYDSSQYSLLFLSSGIRREAIWAIFFAPSVPPSGVRRTIH